MIQGKALFSRYWHMMRSRSTVATRVVAIFFFVAGIAYMRAFDWSMAAIPATSNWTAATKIENVAASGQTVTIDRAVVVTDAGGRWPALELPNNYCSQCDDENDNEFAKIPLPFVSSVKING